MRKDYLLSEASGTVHPGAPTLLRSALPQTSHTWGVACALFLGWLLLSLCLGPAHPGSGLQSAARGYGAGNEHVQVVAALEALASDLASVRREALYLRSFLPAALTADHGHAHEGIAPPPPAGGPLHPARSTHQHTSGGSSRGKGSQSSASGVPKVPGPPPTAALTHTDIAALQSLLSAAQAGLEAEA